MHHLEGNAVSAGHTNAHYRRLTIYNSDAILPQTGKKIDQKCGPEFGGMLWRHLTPHRKNRNIVAQLQSSRA